jgi:hypothetical protein
VYSKFTLKNTSGNIRNKVVLLQNELQARLSLFFHYLINFLHALERF